MQYSRRDSHSHQSAVSPPINDSCNATPSGDNRDMMSNQINHQRFPSAVPQMEMSMSHIANTIGMGGMNGIGGITNMSQLNQSIGTMTGINTKTSPLYNVSRPVSVREYDAASPSENLYPFGNFNASVAIDQHTPLPAVSRIASKGLLSPTSQFQMMTHFPMHRGGMGMGGATRLMNRFSASNSTKDNDLKYKSISEETDDEAMRQSLELRRNMSRSLDVRLEDSENRRGGGTPYTPGGGGGGIQNEYERSRDIHDAEAFSPLPSRRRTQKMDAIPVTMDASNCNKSKSLLIRGDPRNKTAGVKSKGGKNGKSKGSKASKRLKTRMFPNNNNVTPITTRDVQHRGHRKQQSVSSTPPIRSRRKESVLPMLRSM